MEQSIDSCKKKRYQEEDGRGLDSYPYSQAGPPIERLAARPPRADVPVPDVLYFDIPHHAPHTMAVALRSSAPNNLLATHI